MDEESFDCPHTCPRCGEIWTHTVRKKCRKDIVAVCYSCLYKRRLGTPDEDDAEQLRYD
jgi:hypothetical protein